MNHVTYDVPMFNLNSVDFWNSDETMIQLAMPVKKTNDIKGEKQILVKSNKSHERMGATIMSLC